LDFWDLGELGVLLILFRLYLVVESPNSLERALLQL
jgi:hypothetical protein